MNWDWDVVLHAVFGGAAPVLIGLWIGSKLGRKQ